MSLSRRKRKGNISMGKLPPPVGFQIIPASAGGGTNAAAMRPTFSFLAVNQDEVNKRIYAAKAKWLSLNPSKTEKDWPGMDDPYGQDQGKPQIQDPKQIEALAKCLVDPAMQMSGMSQLCYSTAWKKYL